MKAETIQRMQHTLDTVVREIPEEEIEFWFARDIQEALGYARWDNFLTAIRRAIESCETMGYPSEDHFRDVTKMISVGNGGMMLMNKEVPASKQTGLG